MTSLQREQARDCLLQQDLRSVEIHVPIEHRLFNVHLADPLGAVDWPAAAQQSGKLVALFFVVSFGSSLDISAIQADLPMPIDYNAELQTVGAV